MGFAQRLKKLENILARLPKPESEVVEKELTDEEEADALGVRSFQDEDKAEYFQSDSPYHTATRNWYAAVAAARREGHTEYHVGLRPFAMAMWLEMKPGILAHRETHGDWIWDEPPTRGETMPREEFDKLDVREQNRLRLEARQRRGHWSKGPRY
jgi:hypothetical protein